MNIGILKEIKPQENRVSLTPAGAESFKAHGHTVYVEQGAGAQSGFLDEAYTAVGARILPDPAEIYSRCDMIMHVKEPLPSEYKMIRSGQVLFTYFHLAPEPELTRAMMDSGSVCVAYETVQRKDGSLPLLTPMSEIAGKLSVQEGAKYLEKYYGGAGVLLGGVTGVEPATVLIMGGGIVGVNAANVACGMGAKVYVLEKSIDRMRYLSEVMPANCFPIMSNTDTVRRLLKEADLVVGAVLVPGARAPRLVTRDMLAGMKRGTVMVDVAIDQGGCFETSRPTTFADPIFMEQGVIHYCVSNMPGSVPKTSTLALTNATLAYALQLADKGWKQACQDSEELRLGLNVVQGKVTHPAVAEAMGMTYTEPLTLL